MCTNISIPTKSTLKISLRPFSPSEPPVDFLYYHNERQWGEANKLGQKYKSRAAQMPFGLLWVWIFIHIAFQRCVLIKRRLFCPLLPDLCTFHRRNWKQSTLKKWNIHGRFLFVLYIVVKTYHNFLVDFYVPAATTTLSGMICQVLCTSGYFWYRWLFILHFCPFLPIFGAFLYACG